MFSRTVLCFCTLMNHIHSGLFCLWSKHLHHSIVNFVKHVCVCVFKLSSPAHWMCTFSFSHFVSWLLRPPLASPSHCEHRELPSLLSSPLSVSFDKQICRHCPRITTSFDSQLTVNSQSQGGLHYINGKLDYFFLPRNRGRV